MKRLTATDAARRFSEVLDEVENNRETFVVVRNGKVVAQLGPAAAASGRAVKDLLRTNRPDKAWAGGLALVRSLLELKEPRWTG
jgi:antitoxin (DNA-binding transcriptional repressor) of toxin-antitoxin stability system